MEGESRSLSSRSSQSKRRAAPHSRGHASCHQGWDGEVGAGGHERDKRHPSGEMLPAVSGQALPPALPGPYGLILPG